MRVNKSWEQSERLGGLRRFAAAITALNLAGHIFLGFEQSWLQPLVALATAYSLELLLELVDAWGCGRKPRFAGGFMKLVDFFLSAHISALAVAMLLYANERLGPIIFATAAAICSKTLVRAPVGKGTRHFFNPSNFGISLTLVLFPWVGIAPPYHFTENLVGAGDWILPAIIIVTGSLLNTRFTHRLPLIGAWLCGFAAQAFVRSLIFGTPLAVGLLPMTGVAFILYTFYMVTDPATTPAGTRGQVAFGLVVALTYSLLMVFHVVFGLFFALTIVCVCRGVGLYAQAWYTSLTDKEVSLRASTATVVREA